MSDDTDDPLPAELIIPTEVLVPCPACGANQSFDFMQIDEDDSGCWSVNDEHRFGRCPACDGFIDFGAVYLRPLAEQKEKAIETGKAK